MSIYYLTTLYVLYLEINLTFKERKKLISSVVILDSQLIFNVNLEYDLVQLGPIICQSYIYIFVKRFREISFYYDSFFSNVFLLLYNLLIFQTASLLLNVPKPEKIIYVSECYLLPNICSF